jgi:hypothetical protein
VPRNPSHGDPGRKIPAVEIPGVLLIILSNVILMEQKSGQHESPTHLPLTHAVYAFQHCCRARYRHSFVIVSDLRGEYPSL